LFVTIVFWNNILSNKCRCTGPRYSLRIESRHTYNTRVLHLYYMCTTRQLHVYYMCTTRVLHVYYTCTTRQLRIYYMCTTCVLHVNYAFTTCVLHVYYTSTTRLLHVYYVLHVYYTSTTRLLHLYYEAGCWRRVCVCRLSCLRNQFPVECSFMVPSCSTSRPSGRFRNPLRSGFQLWCSAPGFQSDICIRLASLLFEKTYGDMKWGFVGINETFPKNSLLFKLFFLTPLNASGSYFRRCICVELLHQSWVAASKDNDVLLWVVWWFIVGYSTSLKKRNLHPEDQRKGRKGLFES